VLEFDTKELQEWIRSLSGSGQLKEVSATVQAWGEHARRAWVNLVISKSKQLNQPGWWVRNYLGPGNKNIKVRKTGPLSFELYWEGDGRYDYSAVIEGGRGVYDMKKLLTTSKKVRVTKNGVRYLVVPIKTSEPATFGMQKVGEVRIGTGGTRNTYQYDRRGAGNVAEFRQIQKGGMIHTTRAAMVTMTDNSTGWLHRSITGFKYSDFVKDMILSGRLKIKFGNRELTFNESISAAFVRDLERMA
jgi:hypothetical protein